MCVVLFIPVYVSPDVLSRLLYFRLSPLASRLPPPPDVSLATAVRRGPFFLLVSHLQLRVVTVGSEMAAMLRTFRAAGVRDKITGADRRQEGPGPGPGVGPGVENRDGDDLFGGVTMDSLVAKGVVRGGC